jgi:TatD DNase family protein
MQLPKKHDYIDIHNHGGKPALNIYIVECLMAHEDRLPENITGMGYTYGIHPWFLDEDNRKQQIHSVENMIGLPGILAVGEAGFDKLRGPSMDLQRDVFESQVILAEEHLKPVIIHCVRAWDEILSAHKRLRPRMPWMIHGFRGNIKLAQQLLSKGMYLSIWFDFVIRKESEDLLKNLPGNRIFLETDGADIDIKEIYRKVSVDRGITVDELKSEIYLNFNNFFNL